MSDNTHEDPNLAHTIVVGNFADGYELIGIFPNANTAVEWADTNLHRDDYWIAVPIHPQQPYTRR